MIEDRFSEVIIIGGGPAGLTAAIYTARFGVKTLLIESKMLGGRTAEAPEVWNFPGFPLGIRGVELIDRMVSQVKKFGAEIIFPVEVLNLNFEDKYKIVSTRSGKFLCLGLIIAIGTQRRKLRIPGEAEFLGRGLSYCAVCDGPLYKGRTVAVIGSGDEALEDAIYLSSFSEKVLLILHNKEIEAQKALVEECDKKTNIEVLNAEIKSVLGNSIVTSIEIYDLMKNSKTRIPIDGIFFSLGGIPMTSLFKKAGILVDERGCIKVNRRQVTNIKGVYAAGDCTCGGMQIVTATGEGAMAAIQVYRYINKNRRLK
jgi:thioredoxin reductase (NADPH)